ncbi:unnamed protein product, partial [Mesorhabditis belari]|uniref:C-type lectin domain-containing protein n=1 Tax=Mesorhabditis belari TaxID=2138241 RepID=A0AAF3JA82_9BILA
MKEPAENLCLLPISNAFYRFDNGENFCSQNYGGNVIRIENVFANAMLKSIAEQVFPSVDVWVGIWFTGNAWTFTDNTPIPYQAWGPNQPMKGDNLNCAIINKTTGYWSTTDCARMNSVVCAFPKAGPTNGPTGGTPLFYPGYDNILLLIDIGFPNSDTAPFSDLTSTLRALMVNWTNFDRIAFGTYKYSTYQQAYYGDLGDYRDAIGFLDKIVLVEHTGDSNVTSALRRGRLNFQLTQRQTYTSRQKTVLFAQAGTSNDINTAQPYAKAMQDLGKLIVVTVGFSNSEMKTLASDGGFMDWSETVDSKKLIDFLNTQLNE